MTTKEMAMKRWLTIDSSQFRKPEARQIGKATVVSSTSPYSVPDAITTYDDTRSGMHVLEFKYIGPDEPLEAFHWNQCTLEVGKNSKRLFKVLIPSHHQYQVEDFQKCIDHLSSTQDWSEIENYRVVSDVMNGIKDKLTSSSDK
jgi:hypothetical protein